MTTPIAICGVCNTIFSTARYYGGCTIQGKTYVYAPPTDMLIRKDWIDAYCALPLEQFKESAARGIKPELPKVASKSKTKSKTKGKKTNQQSLFEDEHI